MQGVLGGFQPSGGVQSRRELEADFVSAEFLRRLRDFFQCDEPGPLRFVQPLQAGGNQDAVFADERHDVGNRAERDQIQQRAQIKFRRAGQAVFASALDQRVGQFEREAGGAKLIEKFRLRRLPLSELPEGGLSCGFTSATAAGAGLET